MLNHLFTCLEKLFTVHFPHFQWAKTLPNQLPNDFFPRRDDRDPFISQCQFTGNKMKSKMEHVIITIFLNDVFKEYLQGYFDT